MSKSIAQPEDPTQPSPSSQVELRRLRKRVSARRLFRTERPAPALRPLLTALMAGNLSATRGKSAGGSARYDSCASTSTFPPPAAAPGTTQRLSPPCPEPPRPPSSRQRCFSHLATLWPSQFKQEKETLRPSYESKQSNRVHKAPAREQPTGLRVPKHLARARASPLSPTLLSL